MFQGVNQHRLLPVAQELRVGAPFFFYQFVRPFLYVALELQLPDSLGDAGEIGITGARLWRVARRFFLKSADILQDDQSVSRGDTPPRQPTLDAPFACESRPCAGCRTHRRARQPASCLNRETSIYLCGEDLKRAGQFTEAFGSRNMTVMVK